MNNLDYSHLEANLDFRFKNAVKNQLEGSLELARDECYYILTKSPDHFQALNLIGKTFLQQKEYLISKDYLVRSLTIDKNFFQARLNLLICSIKLNDYKSALLHFELCKIMQPDNFIIYSSIALIQKKHLDFKNAIKNYNKAISLNPTLARLFNNRGNANFEIKNYSKAIFDYKKATEIKPNHYKYLLNLGYAQVRLNLISDAEKTIKQSISINKDYAESYSIMGMLKITQNRIYEGIRNFDKAISLDEKNPQYVMNKSIALLLQGDFKQGWKLYEARLQLPSNKVDQSKKNKLWTGKQNLKNKKILLNCEQGLGDTIQFCRYTKFLIKLKAKVILEVQKPLYKFLNQLEPNIKIICQGDIIDFDYYCPLLSLPYLFKTELGNIPYNNGYLKANSKKSITLGNLINNKNFKIGLAFSGNQEYENSLNRDISFEEISEIFSDKFECFCIQKDVNETDFKLLSTNQNINWPIEYISEDIGNTAALIDKMDIIITVDTSLAHLSASMGIKTWILLPYNNDWRWMKNKSYSPWYSSVKIFRQAKLGVWDNVIRKVKEELNFIKKKAL